MSETEKPAEDQATTSANGTGPPVNTGGEVVDKTDEKDNGKETASPHEKKGEDVKMVDAADVNMEGEKKETEELKDDKEAVEKRELAKEKHKEVPEKHEDSEDKCDMAEEKGEDSNEEKGEDGNEEKGDESEEKGEEDEDKSDEAEEKSEECNEEKTEENEEKGTRKKGRRGRKAGDKGEGKGNKGRRKTKELLRTPTLSSIDRPVRERKTVERLVEVVEKDPAKGFLIEKGQGTPLKDIPNVAYKLSKRKPADIRLLHLLLFGRKGKAINYKSHIFQFSGFVWHENEDKQRAKLKEKLDKCVKDRLLDFCDVFDIPVSRATTKKEDLVTKLLDFMVAPHATTDVIMAEREQSTKSRKRKSMSRSALRRDVGISGNQSRKKRTKGENTSKSQKNAIETEDEQEEEDKENGLPGEDEAIKRSETEEEDESEHDNAVKESVYSGIPSHVTKTSSKKRGSPATAKSNKLTTPKKLPLTTSNMSPYKPYSKRFKADETNNSNEVVFSRKKKNGMTSKKKMPSSNADVEHKKATGKKAGRGKAKSDRVEESGPTEEEFRKTICEILKEVDFNTATFTDILKRLASHYNMDLTARKAPIKLMIQDELTKLADEAKDEEEESEDEGDAEKMENSEPAGKEVEV